MHFKSFFLEKSPHNQTLMRPIRHKIMMYEKDCLIHNSQGLCTLFSKYNLFFWSV